MLANTPDEAMTGKNRITIYDPKTVLLGRFRMGVELANSAGVAPIAYQYSQM